MKPFSWFRPIGSAVVGAAAMAAVTVAFDPEWFVRWGVAVGVGYATWGALYLARART